MLFKGPHSGLTQFLIIESPLKIMKIGSYFVLKALFILDIVILTFWFVGKQFDKEAGINFQIYDVTD